MTTIIHGFKINNSILQKYSPGVEPVVMFTLSYVSKYSFGNLRYQLYEIPNGYHTGIQPNSIARVTECRQAEFALKCLSRRLQICSFSYEILFEIYAILMIVFQLILFYSLLLSFTILLRHFFYWNMLRFLFISFNHGINIILCHVFTK